MHIQTVSRRRPAPALYIEQGLDIIAMSKGILSSGLNLWQTFMTVSTNTDNWLEGKLPPQV